MVLFLASEPTMIFLLPILFVWLCNGILEKNKLYVDTFDGYLLLDITSIRQVDVYCKTPFFR